MKGQRRSAGVVLKWFTGPRYWVGYVLAAVAVTFLYWLVGPRISSALNIGFEFGIFTLIIGGLLIDHQMLVAEKAHRAAAELALERASAERQEVEEMYRRMRATVEGEGPL